MIHSVLACADKISYAFARAGSLAPHRYPFWIINVKKGHGNAGLNAFVAARTSLHTTPPLDQSVAIDHHAFWSMALLVENDYHSNS